MGWLMELTRGGMVATAEVVVTLLRVVLNPAKSRVALVLNPEPVISKTPPL